MHNKLPFICESEAPICELVETPGVIVSRAEINGATYVVKAPKAILNMRPSPDSDEICCKEARYRESLKWISHRSKQQQEARAFIDPTGVYAPEELYIVTADDDGLPYPLIIQKEVAGNELRQVMPIAFDHSQRSQLEHLLVANRHCFLNTGYCLDLVGSVPVQEPTPSNFRKFASPLGHSSNIFLTPEGDLALIDPNFGNWDLVNHFGKFLALEREYWKLVALDLRENVTRLLRKSK